MDQSEDNEDSEFLVILKEWEWRRRIAVLLLQLCTLCIVKWTHMLTLSDEDSPPSERGSASRKRKREDATAAEISIIKTVMKCAADMLAEGNSTIERSRPRVYSSKELYAELDCLEIDNDTKVEALEVLVTNEGLARVFMAIPMHARKAWLLKKLSTTS